MWLLLVERQLEDLQEGTAEGNLGGQAAAEDLDEEGVAVEEAATTGSEFLQGVVLLLYLLSDSRTSSSSKGPEGSPKAARIWEIFGCSDMVMNSLEAERCEEMRILKEIRSITCEDCKASLLKL